MTKKDIITKIQEIKSEMKSPDLAKGTAEVYTRISGYYRSVNNFNDGKCQEFEERKEYNILKS